MPTARTTDVARATETLRGIVAGISCDYQLSDEEVAGLYDWLDMHANLLSRKPFSELRQLLKKSLADQVLDEDEREEILEWCQQFSDQSSAPMVTITDGIRRLHGFLQGIIIDGVVSKNEVLDLADWLRDYEALREHWPFDDVWGLVERILEDKTVTEEECTELRDFCLQFCEVPVDRHLVQDTAGENWMQSEAPVVLSIEAIYDKIPALTPGGHTFCFTGCAATGSRKDLKKKAEAAGGIVRKDVTTDLDYLVIGALSQPAWVYSTYGRKIEKALAQKKAGCKTYIISELDFVDAVRLVTEEKLGD